EGVTLLDEVGAAVVHQVGRLPHDGDLMLPLGGAVPVREQFVFDEAEIYHVDAYGLLRTSGARGEGGRSSVGDDGHGYDSFFVVMGTPFAMDVMSVAIAR